MPGQRYSGGQSMGHRMIFVLTLGCACAYADAIVGVNFAAINLNQTFSLGTGEIPPDMGMAVGSSDIVQLVNGGYQVFNKSTGAAIGSPITDAAFWNAAGISTSVTNAGLSDPRVVYDPMSGHYFASEINVSSTGNQLLVAASKGMDPTSGWTGLSFVADSGFADFPTLGLDKNNVYLGTNNFTNGTTSGTFKNVSLFAIPKVDLTSGTPNLNGDTTYKDLTGIGAVPNPAIDSSGTYGAAITIGGPGQSVLITGLGSSLSTTVISGLTDGAPVDLRQPDGTQTVDANDDRFSSAPFIVGNLLYAANTISQTDSLTTHDVVHWVIEDLTTKSVLAQGAISDPNFDFSYPSIAANASGDFVLGFNRSGGANTSADDISSYADACYFNGTGASCGNPFLLSQGLSGSYQLGSTVRWGDYSAISIDPSNPNTFWAAVEVPISSIRWGTQITEITVVPEPSAFLVTGILVMAALRRHRRKDERRAY
jgi:hypothetical protein